MKHLTSGHSELPDRIRRCIGIQMSLVLGMLLCVCSASFSAEDSAPAGEAAKPADTTPSPSLENKPAAAAAKPLPWVKLSIGPAADHPGEINLNIQYGNRGEGNATKVVVRDALPPELQYVKDSASNGGTYDAENKELVWNIGDLPKDSGGTPSLTFRAKPVSGPEAANKVVNVATIECAELEALYASNTVTWDISTSALTAVFALPESFVVKRAVMMPLLDVRGEEFQQAVDRLEGLGVVSGYPDRTFLPDRYVNRAEAVKMVVLGANLKDHRDVTRLTYVLSRPAKVSAYIKDPTGKPVKILAKNIQKSAGDHAIPWDGRSDSGEYVKPGAYSYVVKAFDAKGMEFTLGGGLTVIPVTHAKVAGAPSFKDVKPTDWYSGFVAEAEDRQYVKGYPDKTFRAPRNLSRVEATAVVVRALGLEKEAQKQAGKDVGFVDADKVPTWASGYVAVASTTAPKAGDQLIVGYPGNTFLPSNSIRRTEAAAMVSRFVDRNINRVQIVSGALSPGATLTINGKVIQGDSEGRFRVPIQVVPNEVTTIAVLAQ